MRRRIIETAMDEKDEAEESPQSAPLPKGEPLTLEESIERMYARYARTFEELAK